MDGNKTLELFKLFIGNDFIDINGLILEINQYIEESNTIVFEINNKNDISYHQGVVEDLLSSHLDDFFNYTSLKLNHYITTDTNLYFNSEFNKKLSDTLNKINKLEIIDDHNNLLITILGESVDFNVVYMSDRIVIYNNFKPYKGIITDLNEDSFLSSNLIDAITKYNDYFKLHSSGLESDLFYLDLDKILNEIPLICESDIAYFYHTDFKFI
jgi:hypothetical protein